MVKTIAGKRKIIVYIATSADGYIARSDGSVDWLNRPKRAGDYGMREFYKSIDTILWGRKTHDLSAGYGGKSKSASKGKAKIKNYVFSRSHAPSTGSGVEFVNEPITAFANRLRKQPGKNIWIMGGGGIIASFLDEEQIDEFVIHVIPTFIGAGIPLIAPHQCNTQLKLLSTKSWSDGVVKLHYSVRK